MPGPRTACPVLAVGGWGGLCLLAGEDPRARPWVGHLHGQRGVPISRADRRAGPGPCCTVSQPGRRSPSGRGWWPSRKVGLAWGSALPKACLRSFCPNKSPCVSWEAEVGPGHLRLSGAAALLPWPSTSPRVASRLDSQSRFVLVLIQPLDSLPGPLAAVEWTRPEIHGGRVAGSWSFLSSRADDAPAPAGAGLVDALQDPLPGASWPDCLTSQAGRGRLSSSGQWPSPG